MSEAQIKHLEFIQSNISRMNQNSFQMKGWLIAIISALLAIYAASASKGNTGNVGFIFVAVVPTIIFWFLDSYYLQQERKFRGIYNDVLSLTEDSNRVNIRDFEMPLNKYFGGEYCFGKVMWSKTEWLVYLPIIVGLFVAGFLLK